jgi:hypothetical protein
VIYYYFLGGLRMGLFGKSKEEKERKELKQKVDKLMKSYSKEKIDGDTYFKKMMDLTNSYKKK